jgi:hypothetical protein
MEVIGKMIPTIQIPLSVIKELIAEADQMYEKEACILKDELCADSAENLAEDDSEGKTNGPDMDEKDTQDKAFDAQTLASVDESFDAQAEL